MNRADARILIVNNEPSIRRYLHVALSSHGYSVIEATSSREVLVIVTSDPPDVIVLDAALPDMEAAILVERVRAVTDVPIVVLTTTEREGDKLATLHAGADDYVTKPFEIQTLLTRLEAVQEVTVPYSATNRVWVGEYVVDLRRRTVSSETVTMRLTPAQRDLLWVLIQNAGKLLTRRYLLKQVWGENHEDDVALLRVTINSLRRIIEPESSRPQYILTEPGIGYRFLLNTEVRRT